MTLLEHGGARPSARRTPVSHAASTRLELASQGVIAGYVRDLAVHRPRAGRASAGDRARRGSGPVRQRVS